MARKEKGGIMALVVEGSTEAGASILEVDEYLQTHKEGARQALTALGRFTIATNNLQTVRMLPGLFAPDEHEERLYVVQDLGAVWRRDSDAVSHELAVTFPNRTLEHPIFGAATYYSDGYKVLRIREVDAGLEEDNPCATIAYTSLITDKDMRMGTRQARIEEWSRFLYAMILTRSID